MTRRKTFSRTVSPRYVLEVECSCGAVFQTVYDNLLPRLDPLEYARRDFRIEMAIREKSCDERIWSMFWNDDEFYRRYYSTMQGLRILVDGETVREHKFDI